MHRRLNITLSEETVRLIERHARRGSRSRFIDHAVRHYVQSAGKANLRKMLKRGALERAERDLRMAEEWFELEEGAWQQETR